MSEEAKDLAAVDSDALSSEAIDRVARYAGVALSAGEYEFIAVQLEQSLPLLRRLQPARYQWLSPVVVVPLPEVE